MHVNETFRAVLELEAAPDGIRGWLSYPDGRRLRFSSWLELASSVESLRKEISGGDAGRDQNRSGAA